MCVDLSTLIRVNADISLSKQDLGNTNYCVYVPRLQFERRINAELVARALVNLHIPAQVNERNDICVEGFKMSCSAISFISHDALARCLPNYLALSLDLFTSQALHLSW